MLAFMFCSSENNPTIKPKTIPATGSSNQTTPTTPTKQEQSKY